MNYSPFRHLTSVIQKTKPIQLTFFLTKRCNASCSICFYHSETEAYLTAEPELSLAEIRKISLNLGKLLWLSFSGGEIFLRDDLVEITDAFYRQNRPSIILFPTNGLLTQKINRQVESILKRCPKSTIVVKLSMDGLESVNDSLRNSKGAFRKTMKTYGELKKLTEVYPNFELGINSVFCSENQDHLDDLIDFVAGLEEKPTHTISLIRGNARDRGQLDIDQQKYKKIAARIERDLKNRTQGHYRFFGAKVKAAQDILQRNLILRTLQEKRRLIPCFAGRLNIVISETGDVFPCELLTSKMGNLRNYQYDFQALVGDGMARTIKQRIKKTPCYCTHECNLITNILFNPFLYPSLLKQYLQLTF